MALFVETTKMKGQAPNPSTLEEVAEEMLNGLLCHYEPPDPKRVKQMIDEQSEKKSGILRSPRLGRGQKTPRSGKLIRWKDVEEKTKLHPPPMYDLGDGCKDAVGQFIANVPRCIEDNILSELQPPPPPPPPPMPRREPKPISKRIRGSKSAMDEEGPSADQLSDPITATRSPKAAPVATLFDDEGNAVNEDRENVRPHRPPTPYAKAPEPAEPTKESVAPTALDLAANFLGITNCVDLCEDPRVVAARDEAQVQVQPRQKPILRRQPTPMYADGDNSIVKGSSTFDTSSMAEKGPKRRPPTPIGHRIGFRSRSPGKRKQKSQKKTRSPMSPLSFITRNRSVSPHRRKSAGKSPVRDIQPSPSNRSVGSTRSARSPMLRRQRDNANDADNQSSKRQGDKSPRWRLRRSPSDRSFATSEDLSVSSTTPRFAKRKKKTSQRKKWTLGPRGRKLVRNQNPSRSRSLEHRSQTDAKLEMQRSRSHSQDPLIGRHPSNDFTDESGGTYLASNTFDDSEVTHRGQSFESAGPQSTTSGSFSFFRRSRSRSPGKKVSQQTVRKNLPTPKSMFDTNNDHPSATSVNAMLYQRSHSRSPSRSLSQQQASTQGVNSDQRHYQGQGVDSDQRHFQGQRHMINTNVPEDKGNGQPRLSKGGSFGLLRAVRSCSPEREDFIEPPESHLHMKAGQVEQQDNGIREVRSTTQGQEYVEEQKKLKGSNFSFLRRSQSRSPDKGILRRPSHQQGERNYQMVNLPDNGDALDHSEDAIAPPLNPTHRVMTEPADGQTDAPWSICPPSSTSDSNPVVNTSLQPDPSPGQAHVTQNDAIPTPIRLRERNRSYETNDYRQKWTSHDQSQSHDASEFKQEQEVPPTPTRQPFQTLRRFLRSSSGAEETHAQVREERDRQYHELMTQGLPQQSTSQVEQSTSNVRPDPSIASTTLANSHVSSASSTTFANSHVSSASSFGMDENDSRQSSSIYSHNPHRSPDPVPGRGGEMWKSASHAPIQRDPTPQRERFNDEAVYGAPAQVPESRGQRMHQVQPPTPRRKQTTSRPYSVAEEIHRRRWGESLSQSEEGCVVRVQDLPSESSILSEAIVRVPESTGAGCEPCPPDYSQPGLAVVHPQLPMLLPFDWTPGSGIPMGNPPSMQGSGIPMGNPPSMQGSGVPMGNPPSMHGMGATPTPDEAGYSYAQRAESQNNVFIEENDENENRSVSSKKEKGTRKLLGFLKLGKRRDKSSNVKKMMTEEEEDVREPQPVVLHEAVPHEAVPHQTYQTYHDVDPVLRQRNEYEYSNAMW